MNKAAATVLDGREAFTAAVRECLSNLPAQGLQEIWLVDEQFVGWPFDEAVVLESLGVWLRRGARRMLLIGADFTSVARQHPRFAQWRRDYVHAIQAWQPVACERVPLDGLLLAGNVAVELLDREHWRARRVVDASAVRVLAERSAALLHRCESAWPLTPLGL